MATKKKAATTRAPKAAKTDALSIRIDPRLRFGLELLARKQRRSVTGVVEWAIDQVLGTETADWLGSGTPVTFHDAIKQVWSPNEVERLANLGAMFPDLMTYEEARMWAVLDESPDLWVRSRGNRSLSPICLDEWDKLRPLLVAASERPVVKGLTAFELEEAGMSVIPF